MGVVISTLIAGQLKQIAQATSCIEILCAQVSLQRHARKSTMCIIDYNRYSISFIQLSCFLQAQKETILFFRVLRMTGVLTPTKESKESSTTFTKNSINQGQKKHGLKDRWKTIFSIFLLKWFVFRVNIGRICAKTQLQSWLANSFLAKGWCPQSHN